MIRATTPTQKFILHTMTVKELLITYKQKGEIVLQRTLEDVTLKDGVASFVLKQSEANLFDKGLIEVDCRILTNANVSLASQIFTMSVRDVLDSQILGNDERPDTECACVFDCCFDGCECCDVKYEELVKGDKGDGYTLTDEDKKEIVDLTKEEVVPLIPTKNSQLDNDSNYISEETDPTVPLYVKAIERSDIASWNNKYAKPTNGIPKSDLDSSVKASLEKANTSVQTETDPTVPSHVKAITKNEIDKWNRSGEGTIKDVKQNGVSVVSGDVANVTMPTKTSELTNDSGFLTQHQPLTDYAKKTDLPTKVSQLTNDSGYVTTRDIIDDESTQSNKVWSASKVAQKFSEVEMAKFPNVTIFGQPTIQQGQISNFNATNYCQFPFIVDFKGYPFVIDLETTTGNEVQYQHNILDSEFGLAFAVRNSRFVIAISTNGTSWNIGEGIGTHVIQPNSTYRVRMAWDLANFVLSYSTDGGQTYIEDIVKPLTVQPYPKQMYIGITSDKSTFYNGSINMNYCSLTISGKVIWQGMDDVGLATKADVTLANIDELGERKIKDVAETDEIKTVIGGDPASENAGLELIKQLKEHANKLGGLVDILAELPSDEIGIRIVDALHTSVKLLQEIANIGE